MDLARNTDPARLGDALQTRSDIHPIAVDSGFIMDDIALVDTDPELNSARLFDLGIALPHGRLDCERAFDGVHDTPKLSQDPVACRINDPAPVLPNHREDDCLVLFEITNGGSLVSAHERAIAGDIGSKDRCQFAGNLWISRNIGHRGVTGSNTWVEISTAPVPTPSASALLPRHISAGAPRCKAFRARCSPRPKR